jgi:hypothetical protein
MSLCGRWFNVWNAIERERMDSGMICDFSTLPPDYAWYVKVLYVVEVKKRVKKGHGNLITNTP